MMKSKSMVYVVFAVAVGYFLISSVPGKVAILVEPKMLATVGTDGEEQVLGAPENVTITGSEGLRDSESKTPPDQADSASSDPPVSAEETGALRVAGSNIIDLTMWWLIDLVVAVSVYLVAKNRFF